MSKIKIDQWHKHEALDRASIAMEFFDSTVATHPAIKADRDINALAKEIGNKLADLYQLCGDRYL